MSASIKMMIVKLRILVQPFLKSFLKYKYKDWITWNWVASVWEKCDLFGVVIELNNSFLKLSREREPSGSYNCL